MNSSPIDVSVVIPVHNEADNIIPLAQEIDAVLSRTDWRYEVLWVNDGSTDDTEQCIRELHAKNPLHLLISLPYQIGQSAALWTGFQASRGDILVTLDGDGQNDPRDIPLLVEKVINGDTDVANGYREFRQDHWQRRVASRIANGVRNWIIGCTVRDAGCSLRVMRCECTTYLPLLKGMHRFLLVLFVMQGFTIAEYPVHHRPRLRGQSKYSIHGRLWVGLYDLFGILWLRRRGWYHHIYNIEIPFRQ